MEWKKCAKDGNKMPQFRVLQKQHRMMQMTKGPGLGEPIPHQTYFTKNEEAASFMKETMAKVE